MKWYNSPTEPFTYQKDGLKGKRNGYKIEICDRGKGWYVMIEKQDFAWNSLWSNTWFENIEDAKRWCENRDFAKLQEDYEKAKREETKCQS